MKKRYIGCLLFVPLLFFCIGLVGCPLSTRYETYDLRSVGLAEEDGTLLHIAVFRQRKESWIVPGFYSSVVYGAPFRHNICVWGAFPKIEVMTASIQLDDGEPVSLVVDLEKMNASRKESSRDNRNIFVLNDDSFGIEAPWDDFEKVTIRATIEFQQEGERRTVELARVFEKFYESHEGNELLNFLIHST